MSAAEIAQRVMESLIQLRKFRSRAKKSLAVLPSFGIVREPPQLYLVSSSSSSIRSGGRKDAVSKSCAKLTQFVVRCCSRFRKRSESVPS